MILAITTRGVKPKMFIYESCSHRDGSAGNNPIPMITKDKTSCVATHIHITDLALA